MGTVSHDFENHQKMTDIRAGKVAKVVEMVPDMEVVGDEEADLLVVGWGGTYGHLTTAVSELAADGKSVALAHFNYINPLPANTADVFAKYKKIIVCELNNGQFASFLRDRIPGFTYEQYNKVKGLPFNVVELKEAFTKLLEE
jgi:2-oxoglutarate ferredoxin oxidoreductase subunit alpha